MCAISDEGLREDVGDARLEVIDDRVQQHEGGGSAHGTVIMRTWMPNCRRFGMMCPVLWTPRKSDGRRSRRSSTLKMRRFGGRSFDKELYTRYKIEKGRWIDLNDGVNTNLNCSDGHVARERNKGDEDWFFRINAPISNFATLLCDAIIFKGPGRVPITKRRSGRCKRDKFNLCTYSHEKLGKMAMVHADDFMYSGSMKVVRWFRLVLESKFEVSTAVIRDG